jgi:hypothetical protein
MGNGGPGSLPIRFPRVVDRFPQQSELVCALAQTNADFRSLCEDYTLVIENLRQLRIQGGADSDAAIEEYRGYLTELELDIADALTIAGSPDGDDRST